MSMSIFRRNTLTKLIELSGPVCHYCTGPVRVRGALGMNEDRRRDDATIDHKVPRSAGGTNAFENLLLACRACNEAKADRTYEDFIANPVRLVPKKPEKRKQYAYTKIPMYEPERASDPPPYHQSMMVMRHGKQFMRAVQDGTQEPCECCKPVTPSDPETKTRQAASWLLFEEAKRKPVKRVLIEDKPKDKTAGVGWSMANTKPPLPRGATLVEDPPPLRPPTPKMTAKELAHFIRHHAGKKGVQPPLG